MTDGTSPTPPTPAASEPHPSGPVRESQRIVSLDVLRGLAVLGILTMNIQSFAMPSDAYGNPSLWGSLDGLNGWVWGITHVLGDLKFMAIFSMLFGAGLVLMSERAEARGTSPWPVHLRRMFWLLLFGLIHAHLIWHGDILVWYAVTGTLVYAVRKWRPRNLIALAAVWWLVGSGLMAGTGLSLPYWPEEDRAEMVADMTPAPEVMAAEVAAFQGSYLDHLPVRSALSLELETSVYLIWAFWRVGGLMMLGMALYKLGVFSAARSERFYRRLIGAAVVLGVPLILLGIRYNFGLDWSGPEVFFLGSLPNYFGSLPVALGWVGAVMLLCLSGAWRGLVDRLAAVGRMAFTNYIAQSLICTWIFYGFGLGLFGTVDRVGQAGITLAVWAILLWVSPVWLNRFRFGPLEWLWRSLVYWRRPPMRRAVG